MFRKGKTVISSIIISAVSMNLSNAFRFKHSWQLEANHNSFTHGDFMNMRLLNDSWNLGFVIQKCWLKNDALCLRASLSDALQRTSQKVEMEQSKYKGTGAGREAAGRMSN